MRRILLSALPGAAAAVFVLLFTTAPVKADDFGKRFTISVAPVYIFSTNSDANASAPPPDSLKPLGHTTDNPIVDIWRVDYGLTYKISPKFTLALSHGNVGYQLGRILTLGPGLSFTSGAIFDYTDTAALSYAVGNGLAVHGTYFSHQRQDVTGICLNQKSCPNSVTGVQQPNPLSIDEVGYTLGFTYDFGPNTKVGKLLTAGFDAKYLPRPAGPPSPGASLDSLGHWVGSTTVYPWSMTIRLPITGSSSFIPTFTYIDLPVLYHDSAVPEAYRGVIYGFAKVVSQNLTVSFTYFNIQTCRCIPRVPTPDNLRLEWGMLKFDFHTQL